MRWLTFEDCAYRDNDESPQSTNQGNLLELLKLLAYLFSRTIEVVALL